MAIVVGRLIFIDVEVFNRNGLVICGLCLFGELIASPLSFMFFLLVGILFFVPFGPVEAVGGRRGVWEVLGVLGWLSGLAAAGEKVAYSLLQTVHF